LLRAHAELIAIADTDRIDEDAELRGKPRYAGPDALRELHDVAGASRDALAVLIPRGLPWRPGACRRSTG